MSTSLSAIPSGSMVELQTSNLKVAGSSPVSGVYFAHFTVIQERARFTKIAKVGM